MTNQFEVKTMNRQQLDLAIDWADAEGWNPGLFDADSFYAADPNGFLVGLLNGEPIACISVVKYGDGFGFLGFYIVKPEFRGQGYGWKIWQAGMAYIQQQADRNIGLDGVVDQQENYKRSGFKLAYRNVRYRGVVGADMNTNTASENSAKDCSPSVVELKDIPFAKTLAYDSTLVPEPRHDFLQSWLTQQGSRALAFVTAGEGSSELVGYGVIRPCRSGYKIGPLFADSDVIANDLLKALLADLQQGEEYFLDVPEVNTHAVALADQYAMEVVFETARMYTGEQPDLPLNKVFGVTTFELG